MTPITSIAAAAYRVPTETPEADGTAEWDATTVVTVEVRGGGERGLGWSYTDASMAEMVNDTLHDCVVGQEALDLPALAVRMWRRVRNLGRAGLAATAISAVDVALWDLKARLLDVPLSSLLGRARDQVPVYGSGGFTTYDSAQTRNQLSHWVHDLGIPRVKIKIGESWGSNPARDLERIALARSVIGPDAELYVDANGGYTVGQAVRMAERFADHDVRWFEEPVSSDDLAGLAMVRQQVAPDVAAGEYVYDLYGARRLCEGSVDCLQLDLTRCGGISGWLQAAALAASYNLQVSAHCAPALHAPVAAAVPNLRHVEYFFDHVRIDRLMFDGIATPIAGYLPVHPDGAGVGVVLREADAERFRVA